MPAPRKRRPPARVCGRAGGRPGSKPSSSSSSSSSSSGGGGDGSGSFCPPEGRSAPAPPRLGPAFFDQPCIPLARALLGQVLVRRLPGGEELRARIVETEAYLGGEDSASHSRGGRRTPRNAAMFMPPGTLYVYQIYGIYFCMNISSQGEGAAVLLRSLEPLQGQEAMRQLRLAQRKGPTGTLKDWQLCNGPSKLCQALGVDKTFDQEDLPSHPFLWLEGAQEVPHEEEALVSAPRVGISGDWAHKPLRFYIQGNRCVSAVDRKAEQGSPLLKQPPSPITLGLAWRAA
ncbi:hypothetical protein JRQ81_010442 [Phrynocephalus forsythii]|uniref:DNA-3-methyladenine glycosylase n=1 Tax=Phrynocephalus forsythii TaxID=171643 RepID=A0A9Q0X8I2_9SAUR|nr:hypothetical protein JRQ81_010442 [Phrynocephalus forsythii]